MMRNKKMNKYMWAAAFSGVLLSLAQQPVFMGFLAWVGFIPLLSVICGKKTQGELIRLFMIWGFSYHLLTIFWLAFNIGTPPVVAALSMMATVIFLTVMMLPVPLIWYFIIARTRNPLWAFPFLWTFYEFYRSLGSLAFPWVSVANTQIDYLTLIQNAEYTGIFGITFWVAALNVALFKLWQDYTLKRRMVTAVIFLFPWLTGMWIYHQYPVPTGGSLRVTAVQPNIPLAEKWDRKLTSRNIRLLMDMSQPALQSGSDLVVWPETSIPVYLLNTGKNYLKKIRKILTDSPAFIMTGIPYFETSGGEMETFNAVTMLDDSTVYGVYKKIQLVPMAEYVPLSGVFPRLKELNFGQANFTRGTDYTLFPVHGIPAGAVICFESTMPGLMREFVLAGAKFMVIVVNDGWYETAPEPQQHARQSIYRAIETRRPVIRSANTGISMIISSRGNILARSQLNEATVLTADIFPQSSITFYTRYGNLFVKGISIVLLFILLRLMRKGKYA